MKNKILYIIIIIVSLLISKDRIAYIADVNGYVEILSENNNAPIVEAINGRYLYKGDLIRTFKNSNCVIMFHDQTSMFAIGSYSEVKVRDLKDNIKKINFNYGNLYIENISENSPLFIFTRSSQILSKKSSGFVNTLTNGEDEVFCIENKLELYNKKSNLEVALYADNKVLSLFDGTVELKKSEKNFIPDDLNAIINFSRKNIKAPSDEFNYEIGDLVPNYSKNTYLNTYSPIPEKNYRIFAGAGITNLNNNMYSIITLKGIYDNKYLSFNIEIDQYLSIDSSPELDVWNSSKKILSKIKYLNYKSNSGSIVFNSGRLSDITFGHGLVLKRYSNRYNYPLRNNYGISFRYEDKDFFNLDIFVSDVTNLTENGALVGLHSSLFISKYIPLRIGFGLISDLNQFANTQDSYNLFVASRAINSLQIDLSYNLLSKKGFNVDFISEIGAIIFPDAHYYKRYDSSNDNDLGSGLKDKKGTWGALFGIEGGFQDFIKFKTHFHYNDPLFNPGFFNNSYEFERSRLVGPFSSSIPQIQSMFDNFQISDPSGNSGLIVPKDLYLAYKDDEMVFPSLGITFEGIYNYYNKVITNFSVSNFFEYDSSSNTESYSSLYLDLVIKDKIIRNVADLTIYINRNFAHNPFDFFNSTNENTIIGTSFHAKMKSNFNLIFYFERVNYDYNFDLESESIDNLKIETIYSF